MPQPTDQPHLKYLLLQIRDPDDPIRKNEIRCFAQTLGCDHDDILIHDLIREEPQREQFHAVDAVLIGGSGKYSVVEGGPWLPAALEAFEFLYTDSIPTFASCWGFQAFARALGGRVVTDLNRAELGSLHVTLTDAGKVDPIFGKLSPRFFCQLGHQDIVDELPENAILLASSERVENQAFTFADKPIYATQFHPEMTREDLLKRMAAYPEYLTKITGLTVEEFKSTCQETHEASSLMRHFSDLVRNQKLAG